MFKKGEKTKNKKKAFCVKWQRLLRGGFRAGCPELIVLFLSPHLRFQVHPIYYINWDLPELKQV
jgi:hypothetical protein